MPEQDQQPSRHEPDGHTEQLLLDLINRLERIERRIGIEEQGVRTPLAHPAASGAPRPTASVAPQPVTVHPVEAPSPALEETTESRPRQPRPSSFLRPLLEDIARSASEPRGEHGAPHATWRQHVNAASILPSQLNQWENLVGGTWTLWIGCMAVFLAAAFVFPTYYGGSGSQTIPFLLGVALLNVSIVASSLFKRWQSVIWLSFVVTVVLLWGWALDPFHSFTDLQRWPVFGFLSLYFLLFAGASCFHSLVQRQPAKTEDILLLLLDAFIYAVAGYNLLSGMTTGFAGDAWNGFVLDHPGAFPLALALFFALLSGAAHVRVPRDVNLKLSTMGLAILFLTIAIPLQWQGGWAAIGWSLEAAIVLTLGLRLRHALLHRAGQAIWALSLLPLPAVLLSAPPTPPLLFANERALPLVVSVLSAAWMALQASWSARLNRTEPPAAGAGPLPPRAPVDHIGGVYASYALAGTAWLIAQETYLACSWWRTPSPETWQAGARFAIACLWSAYALVVFALGSRFHWKAGRAGALIVLTLATALCAAGGLFLTTTDWMPLANLHGLTALIVALTWALIGWTLARRTTTLDRQDAEVRGLVPGVVSLLALWSVTMEIQFGFQQWLSPFMNTWQPAALFAVAAWWCGGGFVFLLLGLRWDEAKLRFVAYCAGVAGVALLTCSALTLPGLHWQPFWNPRCLAFAAVTLTLLATASLLKRRAPDIDNQEATLADAIVLVAVTVLLVGLTGETYEACRFHRAALGESWERWAQMAISLVLTIAGALLLTIGILRRDQPLRLFMLGLLGLTALKVFLFDLGFLDAPLRILSFGGLGFVLILISRFYRRFRVGHNGSRQEAQAPVT